MTLRPRLRAALTAAMKARDAAAVAALRSALAAIDNAEAVDAMQLPEPAEPAEGSRSPIAKSVSGLGAAELPRRELTPEVEAAIVAGEADERRRAAVEYDGLGQVEMAARLRAEAAVLDAQLEVD